MYRRIQANGAGQAGFHPRASLGDPVELAIDGLFSHGGWQEPVRQRVNEMLAHGAEYVHRPHVHNLGLSNLQVNH